MASFTGNNTKTKSGTSSTSSKNPFQPPSTAVMKEVRAGALRRCAQMDSDGKMARDLQDAERAQMESDKQLARKLSGLTIQRDPTPSNAQSMLKHHRQVWPDDLFFAALADADRIQYEAEARLSKDLQNLSLDAIDAIDANRAKRVADAKESARKYAREVDEHIEGLRSEQFKHHQSDADVARDLQRSLDEQCRIGDEDARVARRLQDTEDVRATRTAYAWEVGESLDGLRSPRLKHQSDADVARDLHEKSQAEHRQIDADHAYARSLRDA